MDFEDGVGRDEEKERKGLNPVSLHPIILMRERLFIILTIWKRGKAENIIC